jgi:hypothetical protein
MKSPSDTGLERSHRAVIGCIERLENLLEKETAALKSFKPVDFEDFSLRKSHALLELSKAYRSPSTQISQAVTARLNDLQVRLTENCLLLEQHLAAMREIVGIMVRSAEMAESDGTYSSRVYVSSQTGNDP